MSRVFVPAGVHLEESSQFLVSIAHEDEWTGQHQRASTFGLSTTRAHQTLDEAYYDPMLNVQGHWLDGNPLSDVRSLEEG